MEQTDFRQSIMKLREMGFNPVPSTVSVSVPDARKVLWSGIRYFAGEKAEWLPEYEKVAEWMSDNGGRGLLCSGNCGPRKPIICGKELPLVINHCCGKVVSCFDAQQMNADIDNVKRYHLIYVDDIGTESVSVKYGERRMTFPELVDEAEKRGKLLLLTTNLSIDEIAEKYGLRTLDRLKEITKTVRFAGQSLRGR